MKVYIFVFLRSLLRVQRINGLSEQGGLFYILDFLVIVI